MDHALLVRIIYRAANGRHDPDCVGQRNFPTGAIEVYEPILEGFARYVIQHHVVEITVVVEVVHLNDVWVAQLGHRGRFLFKATHKGRVAGQVGVDQFYGDRPLQIGIVRLVHRRHSPLAEYRFDFVAPANGVSNPTRVRVRFSHC